MAYKKLKDNTYQVWVEAGYDIFGKRQRKYDTANTLIEAKEKELELRHKYYHKGKKADTKTLTFKQYSVIFLEQYCKENVSLITKKGYERMLKVINNLIGHRKLAEISPYILDTMYQKIKNKYDDKQLSAETMLHYYRLINVMFSQAVKWEFISENANQKATKPKNIKIERSCYDFQQVNNLLECLKEECLKYRTLIILAIDSGARRGEICDLTWNDIDFEKNEIIIKSSLKIVDGIIDNKNAKNLYSKRNIYVSDITISVLKQFKDYQIVEWEKENKKLTDNCRVFSTPKCEYLHPDTCSKIINKVVKKYNLEKITLHGLRHTSASLLINEGIDLKTVSQRLGHSKPTTTMERYAHAFEKSKIESGKKFDKILEKA